MSSDIPQEFRHLNGRINDREEPYFVGALILVSALNSQAEQA
jgi:hypothetical protein